MGTRAGGIVFGNTAGAASQVFWDDGPIKQKVRTGFQRGARRTGAIARLNASRASKRVARSIRVQFFSGGLSTGLDIAAIVRASHPLAHLFEGGAGAHVIAPQAFRFGARALTPGVTLSNTLRKRSSSSIRKAFDKAGGRMALKFNGGDGGFSRGSVVHPGMKPQPFMRPTLPTFPPAFRAEMRRLL